MGLGSVMLQHLRSIVLIRILKKLYIYLVVFNKMHKHAMEYKIQKLNKSAFWQQNISWFFFILKYIYSWYFLLVIKLIIIIYTLLNEFTIYLNNLLKPDFCDHFARCNNFLFSDDARVLHHLGNYGSDILRSEWIMLFL